MQKSYPPTGFKIAVFRLPVIVIQRLKVRMLLEDNFLSLLILSTCRSGGSFLGFRAGRL